MTSANVFGHGDVLSFCPMQLSPSAPPSLAADDALFLDFDGTMVELAPTPDAIEIPTCLVGLLADLQHLLEGALAVVSGRPVEALDRFLVPLELPLAGEHGMQRRNALGRLMTQAAPDLSGVLAAMNQLAVDHAGLLVERKQAAVALHYRLAPQLEALCREAASQIVNDHPELELLHGKCVFEVKASGTHKGTAIDAFLREAPFAGRRPVFVGDDTTDESGFAVVQRRRGVAIKVGAGPSQALHRLAGPPAVLQWLESSRDWLARHPKSASRGPT